MSTTNFTSNGQMNTASRPGPILKTSLDLNEVLNESIKKYHSGYVKDIIIRCESLPVIEADRKQMVQLFDNLVCMIMSVPPSGSKLFLYVDCEENKPESLHGKNTLARKEFTIKFHTNITTNDTWKEKNAALLASCEQFVLAHKGTFGVNNINNTGCLFSITFPGKLN